MDLRELLKALRKRIGILIIIPLAAMLTSALISWFYIAPVYQSTTTLMVGKSTEQSGGSIDYNQLLANQQLVKTYREIAQSGVVTKQIIEETGVNLTPTELKDEIQVELVGDTELIQIIVEDKSPDQAWLIAKTAPTVLKERIAAVSQTHNIKTVDPAFMPKTPVKPNKVLNVLVAGIVSFMLAVAIIFGLEFMDNTIKNSEDVQKYLGIPVLGVIPDLQKLKGENKANG